MFNEYIKTDIEINGYQAKVIDKQKIPLFLNDRNIKQKFKLKMIQQAIELNFLEVGFVYLPNNIENFQWYPVFIYYFESGPEFVFYSKSWMCRDCGYWTGPILIHQIYRESFFTCEEIKELKQKIDLLFPRRKCPQCNHLLQGNPILLENR